MVSLTHNESKVINFLLRNFSQDYNINQIARELHLSPRGAYKILKKLEKNQLLRSRGIGNNFIYTLDFEQEKVQDVCQFVLTEKETTPYVRAWIRDLQPLRKLTMMVVLFGSVLTKDKQAGDIDVFLVFNQKHFSLVQEQIKKINQIKSKKIHPLIQTKTDLSRNLQQRDPVVLNVFRTGLVLWGRNVFVEVIKHEQS